MFTGLFEHLSPHAYPSLTPPTFPPLILSLRHATAPPRLLLLQPACIKDRRPTRRWDCGESTVSAARPQARPLRLAVGEASRAARAGGSEWLKRGSLVAGHWRLGRWRPVVPGSAGSAETPPRQQPQLGRESRDRRRPGRRRPDREPQRPCLRPRR